MKVICTQENLKSGLLAVGRIISSSNTLPILNNILFKTENGLLKVSATNLEIAITTYVRCKIEDEGETTINSKTITDLVNNLPNQNITLETNQDQLKIETENYHTIIKTLSAEEFPLIPTVEKEESLSIDSQDLKKAIDEVVFAVSPNQTQPEISGVLFGLDNEELRMVATDRYRLAEKKLRLNKKNDFHQEVIVPQKTVLELSRIIGGQKGKVEFVLNNSQALFTFNNTQIVSRLIDGQYPDYKQIIPTTFSTVITTDKQPLINALRTTGIFSQGTNSVKFEYDESKQVLILVAESQDLGKSQVELPSKIEGRPGTVVLNYHYVLECLQSVDTDRIIIKIVDENSPSLMIPEGRDDYVYLVMPIKS